MVGKENTVNVLKEFRFLSVFPVPGIFISIPAFFSLWRRRSNKKKTDKWINTEQKQNGGFMLVTISWLVDQIESNILFYFLAILILVYIFHSSLHPFSRA